MTKRLCFKFVGNGLFLQTALIQITVGFFWWKLLVNQKYSDPCRCFGKLTREGWGWGKNLHLWGNSTKLAWCFATPRALPICRSIDSLSACLIWPWGCFLDLLLSKTQEQTMFLVGLKHGHWVCLYQSMVPLMRSAGHLLSKSIKKCSRVSDQIPMPSRWLLFIVHFLG